MITVATFKFNIEQCNVLNNLIQNQKLTDPDLTFNEKKLVEEYELILSSLNNDLNSQIYRTYVKPIPVPIPPPNRYKNRTSQQVLDVQSPSGVWIQEQWKSTTLIYLSVSIDHTNGKVNLAHDSTLNGLFPFFDNCHTYLGIDFENVAGQFDREVWVVKIAESKPYPPNQKISHTFNLNPVTNKLCLIFKDLNGGLNILDHINQNDKLLAILID